MGHDRAPRRQPAGNASRGSRRMRMGLGALPAGWARTVNTAVTHLPLLPVVLLSGPALIICPFLPQARQKNGQALVQILRSWHVDILGTAPGATLAIRNQAIAS